MSIAMRSHTEGFPSNGKHIVLNNFPEVLCVMVICNDAYITLKYIVFTYENVPIKYF